MITTDYIAQVNRRNQRVHEYDQRTRQAASLKVLQRSNAAKMAAREKVVQLPASMEPPQKRRGRLLGIVQPAGYAVKSDSSFSQNGIDRKERVRGKPRNLPSSTQNLANVVQQLTIGLNDINEQDAREPLILKRSSSVSLHSHAVVALRPKLETRMQLRQTGAGTERKGELTASSSSNSGGLLNNLKLNQTLNSLKGPANLVRLNKRG